MGILVGHEPEGFTGVCPPLSNDQSGRSILHFPTINTGIRELPVLSCRRAPLSPRRRKFRYSKSLGNLPVRSAREIRAREL